jgi:quinol monooxygenase YgiN
MRAYSSPVLRAAVLGVTLVGTAHAQNSPIYVVTYIDVTPSAAASGTTLLEGYGAVTRKESGNMRFDVLREIARPNRFVILEIWSDSATRDAHAKASGSGEFAEKLKAIESAPPDVRLNNGLYVEPAKAESPHSAIYVVTHVDVVPASKDDCVVLLKAMSAHTRNDLGNISYDVLQQANRPNHFSVVEVWANRKAFDGHANAAHTRAFREKLSPMTGALFDERLYVGLKASLTAQ